MDKTIEEMKADDLKLIQNAVQLKRQMEDLKEDGNFIEWTKRIKEQIEQRQRAVFDFPAGGLDSIVKNVYTTGEIAGLRMAVEFTDIMIDFANLAIQGQKAKEKAKEEMREEELANG